MHVVKKGVRAALLFVAFLGLASRTVAGEQKQSPFEGLIAAAEAVVAAEIVSTDYSATPADGPMVAVGKIWKVLKGPIVKGQQLRFAETAWVGPSYQKGEYRILFLEKNKSREFPRTSQWQILSHLRAKDNFFFETDSIAKLSLETLEALLKKIESSGKRPKRIVFDKGEGE